MSRFLWTDGICRRVQQKAGLISVLFSLVHDNFVFFIIPYLIKLAYDTQANKTLSNDEAKAVVCSVLKLLYHRALGREEKGVYVPKQRVNVWRGNFISPWSFNETNIEILLTELMWMHKKKKKKGNWKSTV